MVQNQNINSSKKVLLHACCGICSGYPISLLQDMGYSVVVYFYNPNIFPADEYQRRLEAEKTLCAHYGCNLIIGDYETDVYYDLVKGLENEPEKGARCDVCIEMRFRSAAKKAKELGISKYTTSLVISPHKNFEKISDIGKRIDSDLEYLAINFKKKDGFLKTNKLSKDLGIYRQNYCGCEFSK